MDCDANNYETVQISIYESVMVKSVFNKLKSLNNIINLKVLTNPVQMVAMVFPSSSHVTLH
jgi:hypothetical protein